jgi:hypothetical protein
MKFVQHIAVSVVVSTLVWVILRSSTAALACFLTGVFIDIDHLIDYFWNYGWKLKPRQFFKSFDYEVFENIVVFLHSWEFIAVYLAIVWLIDWQPVATGALIGIFIHLLLDHFFNGHSRFGYFFSYRLWHGFSGRHFYGADEYQRRLKRQRDMEGKQ